MVGFSRHFYVDFFIQGNAVSMKSINFYYILIGLFFLSLLYKSKLKNEKRISNYLTNEIIPERYPGATEHNENIYAEVRTDRESFQKSIYRWGAAIVAITIYLGVYLPMEENSFNETAESNFYSDFQVGFQKYCNYLFSPSGRGLSRDGTLYADGISYDESWCSDLLTTTMIQEAFRTSAYSFEKRRGRTLEELKVLGENLGSGKALETVFLTVPYLCWGTECADITTEEEDMSPSESDFGY